MTAASLVVYRRREGATRAVHFRAPFYPWSVVLFVLACVYVVAGAVVSNPENAARGVILLAAGVPVYGFWSRRAR